MIRYCAILLLFVHVGCRSIPVQPSLPESGEHLKGDCKRVVDGDTFIVSVKEGGNDKMRGKDFTIRLEGIDCPESNQPHGKQATVALERMIQDQPLEIVVSGKDRNKRLIAIVKTKGTQLHVNFMLTYNGHAWDYPKYSDGFYAEAQEHAKRNKLGLWAAENPTRPWEWRKR